MTGPLVIMWEPVGDLPPASMRSADGRQIERCGRCAGLVEATDATRGVHARWHQQVEQPAPPPGSTCPAPPVVVLACPNPDCGEPVNSTAYRCGSCGHRLDGDEWWP